METSYSIAVFGRDILVPAFAFLCHLFKKLFDVHKIQSLYDMATLDSRELKLEASASHVIT